MLTGTRFEYTRKYNRRIIVEAIRRNGPIARSEIARMTGLTPATISNITSELIQQDIVVEKGRRKSQRGQPAVELEINANGRFSIGFELARHHLSGVAIDLSGKILAESHQEWNYPSPETALPAMAANFHALLEQSPISKEHLLGIGVAMPGPFLSNQKTIVVPIDFPHWERFPVVEKFTETLGHRVIVESNTTAAAIAEQFHGKGTQYQNFFYVYFGFGIGGALIFNTAPYQGISLITGAIGSMIYGAKNRRARIEQYLGLKALYNFLKSHNINISHPKELEVLFEQQNIYLQEWLHEAVDCLESVLDAIRAIVGPEAIFLGGRFPGNIVEYFIQQLHLENSTTQEHINRFELLRATSGDLSSALGAATLPLYASLSVQRSLLHPNSSSTVRNLL